MLKESKNKKPSLSDFIRYHGNKMSGRERNAFERELQKDPFIEEAEEGFETITPEEAEEDILSIRRRLANRTTGKQRFTLYRIAASVALLMAISSVFIIIQRNRPEKQSFDLSSTRPEEIVIIESKPPVKPDKGLEKPVQISAPSDIRTEKSVAKQEVLAVAEKPVLNDQEFFEMAKAADTQPEIPDKRAKIYVANDQLLVPVAAMATGRKVAEIEVISKTDSAKGEARSDYIPAQPLTGKDNYDKYIQENIHRPDTIRTGQRVVVILEFKVLNNGKIDSIRIVQSPDILFSEEAIRLVKEGPEWKPAEQNKVKIDDRVIVRIVFR
jgi:outer membrane biosynthesis protein TonB